jgi:hypothetical protein
MHRTHRHRWRARAVARPWLLVVFLAPLLLGACETRSPLRLRPGPVIKAQRMGTTRGALEKVAIIPFYPSEQLRSASGPTEPGGANAWETAALIGNFMSEALAAQGIPVITPNDMELAFTGAGSPVPRLDPKAAAAMAANSFGATGVVLGHVLRYRERPKSTMGNTGGASVAFEVSLFEVQAGRRLWKGRFDETQQTITGDILKAANYPGGGTRWLSAAEFARWAADEAAKSMVSGP